MDKNKKNKKHLVSSEDHYTNLMLIVVAEAMVLLIIQMLIYNSYIGSATQFIMINNLIPIILIVSLIVVAISAVLYFLKKKNALISLVFGAYMALLMGVIRYIPNTVDPSFGLVPSTERGQKFGLVLSVIYVVGGILYCIFAEKRRVKLKNK